MFIEQTDLTALDINIQPEPYDLYTPMGETPEVSQIQLCLKS